MSTAALVSIIALAIVVIISCIKEEIHPGILGVGFAIIVGTFWVGMSGKAVMTMWPTSLFMILLGVTYFFSMSNVNGTMQKLTDHAVRLCGSKTAFIPLVIFLLTTFFTTIGPGNIAAVAFMAPVAMAIATRIGLPAFLMTLVVVGGANGAGLSPISPTGIISQTIIAEKIAPFLPVMADVNLNALGWKIHLNSEIAQSTVNLLGFLFLGGLAWIAKQRDNKISIDDLIPKPEPFTKEQKYTVAAIAVLLFMVIVPNLPGIKEAMPKAITGISSNVGAISFILAAILLLLGAANPKDTIKAVPWSAITLVCGVSVLIGVMEEAGGLMAMVNIIAGISTPVSVNGWLAFITGVLSAYSSSSGVVMPMFLPMVPGLIDTLGGGDPISLISSIDVGSHLVDSSPLSTLGALCIACAGEHENKTVLFRNLLIWGLSMSVVGGLACWFFFGILSV